MVILVTDHEKDLERIKNFSLMDDEFMTACFAGNTECTELVIRIILDRPDLKVIHSSVQETILNLIHRSVRLDVLAEDAEGNRHNIEIQRSDKGTSPKRARYNGSLIDASISEPGEEYNHLPDVYVIFITEKDKFHKGEPLYWFERQSTKGGIYLNDGSHIIYVNGEYQNDSPIGLLIKDFWCKEPDDMHYAPLKERATYFKKTEEGVGSMCRAIEEMREETAKNRNVEIARKMLADKLPIEMVVKYTELSMEEVTALATTLPQ